MYLCVARHGDAVRDGGEEFWLSFPVPALVRNLLSESLAFTPQLRAVYSGTPFGVLRSHHATSA